jgi:hypothetical protein
MGKSLVENLQRLAKLHGAGEITEDEFEQLKGKLIAEIVAEDRQDQNTDTEDTQKTQHSSAPFDPTADQQPRDEKSGKTAHSKLVLSTAAIIIFSIGALLFFSGGSEPDCGSSDAQSAVIEIAAEDLNNSLINYAIANSAQVQESIKKLPITREYEIKERAVRNQILEVQRRSFGRPAPDAGWGEAERARIRKADEDERGVTLLTKLQAELKSLEKRATAEQTAIKDGEKKNAKYQLDTIRTNSKDPDTHSVTCTAKLIVGVAGMTANKEINYKIEKTSEGRWYATVWGL